MKIITLRYLIRIRNLSLIISERYVILIYVAIDPHNQADKPLFQPFLSRFCFIMPCIKLVLM